MCRHTFYKFLTALLHKTKISIGFQNALFSGWHNFSQFFKVNWDLSGIGLGGVDPKCHCKAQISDVSYQRSFHNNKIVFPFFFNCSIGLYNYWKGEVTKIQFVINKTVKTNISNYSIIGLSLLASPTRMKEDSQQAN